MMTETRDLTAELVTFVRKLDAGGVRVPADGALTAAEAWVVLDAPTREATRIALRSSLLTRRSDFERFDQLFDVFWRRITGEADASYPSGSSAEPPVETLRESREEPSGDADTDGEGAPPNSGTATTTRVSVQQATTTTGQAAVSRYSPTGESERLSAESTVIRADRSIERDAKRFVRSLASLGGRRWEPDQSGRAVDGARALRRSLETGGAVVPLPRRAPKQSEARAVLFVDVSRSVLDALDRGFLLRFVGTLHTHLSSMRVFFFDTELREVTDAFAAPTLRDALHELERAETVWGGGTRIGESLAAARERSPEAVDWRTTVVVISDGLERGDIDRLEGAMAWLSRRARNVLWLNPLAVSPEYEPAARGMRAALPHVDGFYGFAGPDDLARIADDIRMYGPEQTLTAPR